MACGGDRQWRQVGRGSSGHSGKRVRQYVSCLSSRSLWQQALRHASHDGLTRPAMETLSTSHAHGGVQGVYRHASVATGTDMTFSVFVPPHAEGARLPVVWYLSGLTCTHANVTEKGEYRRACAELGLIFVAPDTSPRGEGVADDPQ